MDDEDPTGRGAYTMPFVFDDGGRGAAGFKGHTRDCVTRAITIATGLPYQQVYDAINEVGKAESRDGHESSARKGVQKDVTRRFMERLGWTWHPTMHIGQGCKVHLAPGELPQGRVIASVSRHLVAVLDGVVHDTSDPGRGGKRCVYGYWTKEAA